MVLKYLDIKIDAPTLPRDSSAILGRFAIRQRDTITAMPFRISRRDILAGACAVPLLGQSAANKPIELAAGPMRLVFEPEIAFVRYVRAADREVLRGIYAAVRDSVWGTVGAQIRNVQVKQSDGGFRLTFTSEHKRGDIDFVWDGELTGTRDGVLKFTFDGKARSTFARNRIGFCVLHPMRECAGQPCAVEKTSGEVTQGMFPDLISPHQPFLDLRAVRHTVVPGLEAEVRMEGDTFEMEDHRNWTDANFKTYCTPLAKPYPVTVEAGTRVQQSVTLTLKGGAPRSNGTREAPVELRIGSQRSSMPKIGFGFSRSDSVNAESVRSLGPAHLRLDVHLSKPGWREELAAADALGIPLEVAIFGSPEALLSAAPKNVARYLMFDVESAPPKLNNGDVLAGTNDYFTELNRKRPAKGRYKGTCYSINPQVHAFDNGTLVENLEAQASTVRTARSFLGDGWIAVTPVTLRPRFIPANGAPVDPDPRQSLPFNAAWTLGSIKYLAEAGANSVTYFELAGKGGVLGFPVAKVFEMVRGADGILASESSDPLRVISAVLTRGGERQVLLANMTGRTQRARVSGRSIELTPYEVRSV